MGGLGDCRLKAWAPIGCSLSRRLQCAPRWAELCQFSRGSITSEAGGRGGYPSRAAAQPELFSPERKRRGRGARRPSAPRLGDFAVAPGAVLRGALGRPDGLGALQAVALAASRGVG